MLPVVSGEDILISGFGKFDVLSPIIIHTMGKVGSLTVEATLKNLNLPVPIFQTHFLSWKNLQEVEQFYLSLPRPHIPNHIVIGKQLREMIDDTRGKIQWNIITLVRDPVARTISDLFENLDDLLPGVSRLSQKDMEAQIHSYLADRFANFDEATDYVCTWFDKEIKDVFSFDVFTAPFEKKGGYHIYHVHEAKIDILVIKLEKLSDCYRDAFAEFLGLYNTELVRANIGEEKWYHTTYRRVESSTSIELPVLQGIYGSRYMQHFYASEEIERFIQKWSKA